MGPALGSEEIRQRSFEAAKAYVARVGMEVLADVYAPECFLVREGDEEVLVLVQSDSDAVPTSPIIFPGRMDLISLRVVAEDRALLRHLRDYDPRKTENLLP